MALTPCFKHTGREEILCIRNLGHLYTVLDFLENILFEDLGIFVMKSFYHKRNGSAEKTFLFLLSYLVYSI